MKWEPGKFLLFLTCSLSIVQLRMIDASNAQDLNRCLDAKHHKVSPGEEGEIFKKYPCWPWAKRSCCTNKTAESIDKDGVLTLYNMKWDHCMHIKNLSSACYDWFIKDTCFYECSPNIGPFIVVDKRSKVTRKERVVNVPLCAVDCDAWFDACKNDFTCSDNWGKNWKWTKNGNQCIKECRTFKDHFQDSENFCNTIFDRSFEYTLGEPGKDCFSLFPAVNKDGNPNEIVARIVQKSHDRDAAIGVKVSNFLDRCVATNYHKSKPGEELEVTECVPWRSHSCCTKNTTTAIKKDGWLTLFNINWTFCGDLSKQCKAYFVKSTCFYSCSPNLSPWIVQDSIPNKARTERVMNVPLCSEDCDDWFEACKDDFACADNLGETWKWDMGSNECKLGCKRYKDYFKNSTTFCNKLFDHSFVYTDGKHGEDCMSLWPDSGVRDLNRQFASKIAHNLVSAGYVLHPQVFTKMGISFYTMLLYVTMLSN